MTTLVIAEHDNSTLKSGTLNAITAGLKIDNTVDILVCGKEIGSVAEAASLIEGVSKVISVDNAMYEHQLAEAVAPLIADIGKNYSHILTAASTTGKNLLPRAAALLDVAQISDIISVESQHQFKRPIYAGSCIATVKSTDAVKVITVRSTAFDPVGTDNNGVEVVSVDASDSLGISSFVSEAVSYTHLTLPTKA